MPLPVDLPPVAWGASDIQPLVAELVALTEELCNGSVVKKATAAKLPKAVIDEIEKDLGWSDRPKKILADGLSEVSANGLNATGVPVVAKPYLKIAIAGTQIAVGQMKIMATLEKLIAEHQKQQPAPAAKPEEKKP